MALHDDSALGADPAFSRVNGELAQDLAMLGFRSLTFVRPSLIGGTWDEVRPAERVTSLVLGFVTPILPRRWRINLARKVAQALADAFVAARPGRPIVASAEGEQPHINPTASPRQRACHPA
jgi:hypothetical protein